MLNQIMKDVSEMETQRQSLKSKAFDFPEIYTERKNGILYASTMVRFLHKDVWCKTHLVESLKPSGLSGMPNLLKSVFEKGYYIHNIFVWTKFGQMEMDECQLSEKERIHELLKK